MNYKSTGSLKALQAAIHQLTRHSANKSFNNKSSNALGMSKNVISYAISALLQIVTPIWVKLEIFRKVKLGNKLINCRAWIKRRLFQSNKNWKVLALELNGQKPEKTQFSETRWDARISSAVKKNQAWLLFPHLFRPRGVQKEGLQVSLSSLYSKYLKDFTQCFPSLTVVSIRKIQFKFSAFSLVSRSFSSYKGHAIFWGQCIPCKSILTHQRTVSTRPRILLGKMVAQFAEV